MSRMATLPPREDGFVRKKWSVQECRFLVQSGLLTPGKYELIEGEIIYKGGQSRLHICVVSRLFAVLSAIFGSEPVQSQAQVGIGEIDPYSPDRQSTPLCPGRDRRILGARPQRPPDAYTSPAQE